MKQSGRKFTQSETRQAMTLAHSIRSQAAESHNCKKSDIPFGECLKMAYNQIQGQQEITYQEWLKYYNSRKNYFNKILWKASAELQIDIQSEFEDILQTIHSQILNTFSQKQTIKFSHRNTIFAYAAKNAIVSHSRMIKRSKLSLNPNSPLQTGYGSEGERIAITDDTTQQSQTELEICLKGILSSENMKIVSLLKEGFNKSEIAEILNISRQAVHKQIRTIRKKITKAGLYIPTNKSAKSITA